MADFLNGQGMDPDSKPAVHYKEN